MFKRTKVCSGVLVALGGAFIVAALPAHAQERIEITGSRIKSIGATSSSPITSVGKTDIETTQPVAVEEIVRGLSSSYPGIGPGLNNGSNGTASIDLRGMGTNRTLVLINGRRMVPATLGGVVDTNTIPVSLLERIDLVTGGASAVYGADAVAGVVNFITRRNFSGVEASTMYSVSEQGDAKRRKSDLTIGANLADGRGNVVVHVGTTRTEALRLDDRDFARGAIAATTGLPGGYSATGAPSQYRSSQLNTLIGNPNPAYGNNYTIDATTGLLRASTGSNPGDGYNTNPPNYFETPLTRTQATGLARFTINEYAEAYSEMFFTRSNVTLNLAPSGTFGNSLTLPIGNPFIPQAVRNQLCSAYSIAAANCVSGNATPITLTIDRRFVEAGPRIYNYDNTSFQYTFGLRGAIPMLDTWSYDTYYQKGRSEQVVATANGFSTSKLRNAINAVNTTSCVGNPAGCVPIDLFGPVGSITPAMLNYLATPTFQSTLVTQEVISAAVNGEIALAKSPLAKTGLGLALGAEQREVYGGNRSDAVVQTQSELLGSGAPVPDRNGVLKFKEYYLEARLPLIQGLPFVEELNLGGGYRNTKFETTSSQTYGSWKTNIDWAPIKGLRLRAEQQRATRAPNVNELYQPVTTGLANRAIDPCGGAAIGPAANNAALTALCVATGVPAAFVGSVPQPSSGQIANTSGGNPNLGPERADTTTFGIVWEPEFVQGLSVTVDVWKIDINGAVSSPTAEQVIDGCYTTALNPGLTFNSFCGLINRSTVDGGLSGGTGNRGVSTQSSNLGGYDYKGVDIGANYRLNMRSLGMPNLGRIDLGLTVTLLDKADFKSLPSVPVLEQAGYYGTSVGNPYPKTRFVQRATWSFGDFSLGYNWRYIGKTEEQPGGTVFQPQFSTIKAYNYVDLNGSWQVLKNLRLSLTVNNAFDKEPPIVGTNIAGTVNVGNTLPMLYDTIGRRYTMTATASF